MPNDATKKTAWGRKPVIAAAIGLALVGVALLVTVAFVRTPRQPNMARTAVHTSTATLQAFVATTVEERQKGLSGTSRLPGGQAMLFVFPVSGYWDMWMKDMHYAIDIVWLDATQKVVDVAEGISPSTYPEKFGPRQKALYVLELAEGGAKKAGLRIGERVDFSLP